MKKIILTEKDCYQSPFGRQIRGANNLMCKNDLVVFKQGDGSFEVLKNRFDLSHDEILREIDETQDNTILLAL